MFDDKSQDLTKVAKPAKITFLVSFPVPYGVQGGAAKSGSVFEPFELAHAAQNWRGKSCTWFACSSAIY